MKKMFVHKNCTLFWAVLFFCLTTPFAASAATPARAVYQSIANKKVVFLVEVGITAPSSLIVQHYHPRDNRLISTSPQADKIERQSGTAKWFLKNVSSGMYPFSLSFTEKIDPDTIQLILRYRDPQTGSFQESVVRP
jgi:hypothetical protein